MNAVVDEELPRLDDSSRDADVPQSQSQYEYTIMYETGLPRYGVHLCKCASGEECVYGGEGRIVKGQTEMGVRGL